jgi:hypothetical protein
VSLGSLNRAVRIRRHGIPDLVSACEAGLVRVQPAAEITRQSPEVQRRWLAVQAQRPYRRLSAPTRALVAGMVESLAGQQGELPSSRQVAHELGLRDDRTVRKWWDRLAAEGKLPPRPKAAPATPGTVARRAGHPLLVAEECLRRFLFFVNEAPEAERDACSPFWVAHLAEVRSLLENATGLLLLPPVQVAAGIAEIEAFLRSSGKDGNDEHCS